MGKTELLEELFAGRGEIISADSMQVYRFMDIGTAKPSRELQSRLPHHLIDIVDPHSQFHAGEFVLRAEELIRRLHGRGKIPVIAGGTGFYFHNFLFGLPPTPQSDPAVREELQERQNREGCESLYRELREKDPDTAERLAPGDSYRILRALEVLYSSGRPLSSFPRPRTIREDMRLLLLGLQRDREELYRRIDLRVEQMFCQGLYREFRELLERGYGPEDPGMRGIGYREFLEMPREGCLSLEGVKERIRRNSRHYAKRQLTFFRPFPQTLWFHPEQDARALRETVERFLGDRG